MSGCYSALSSAERERLHAWEAEHLGKSGKYGTSDWPGWERYIGRFEPASRQPKETDGHVYLIQSARGYCKIGSSRSVSTRLRQLQCANPEALSLLHQFSSPTALRDELALHAQFAHRRIKNEWFALTEQDIECICKITHSQGNY
ncbi:GIY-YIG nuclease family protein [Achromobacter xylosoxidans]